MRRLERTNAQALAARDSALNGFRHALAGSESSPAATAPDPFSVAENHVVALPVRDGTAFAIGQSDLLPSVLGVGVMNAARLPQDRYGFENPLHLLTGRFDLAVYIILVIPLIVLVLAFDILSSERESGTMVLVLSQPIHLRSWILGKLTARAVLIAVLALGIPLIGLALAQPRSFQSSVPVVLWALLVTGYTGIWLAVATLINLGRSGSGTNAFLLVASWISFVVVAPALLQVAAAARYPVPSRMDAIMASRDNPRDYFPAIPALARAWYERQPQLATTKYNAASVVESFPAGLFLVQEDMDRQAASRTAGTEQQISRQRAFVSKLAWISPAIALKQGLEAIAGTGTARHQAFRLQVQEFRAQWRAYFATSILHALPHSIARHDSLPHFRFQEPVRSEQRSALHSVLAVWLWFAALAVAAGAYARHFTPIG